VMMMQGVFSFWGYEMNTIINLGSGYPLYLHQYIFVQQ
jgi:hypothetical protein